MTPRSEITGRFGVVVLLFVIAFAPARANVASQASASVVRVIVQPDDEGKQSSLGSGFKIAPGLYLTNRHVVEDSLGRSGYQIWIIPSGDQTHPIRGQLRATAAADLALIAAGDMAGAALTLTTAVPDPGDPVSAIGYPHQVDDVLENSHLERGSKADVTTGTLINSGQSQGTEGGSITKLIHSASLWPGNSGGPLIDRCGRVIGINTWLHAADGLAQQSISIASVDISKFLADNGVSVTVQENACNDAAGKNAANSRNDGVASATVADSGDNGETAGGVVLALLLAAAVISCGVLLYRHLETQQARNKHAREAADSDEW